MPKGTKNKKRPTRPPRVKIDKKGRRYIKYKGTKYFVHKKIREENLVNWIIKRFHKKRKPKPKELKKLATEKELISAPKNQILQQLREDVAPVSYLKALKAQTGEHQDRKTQQQAEKKVKADLEEKVAGVPHLIMPPAVEGKREAKQPDVFVAQHEDVGLYREEREQKKGGSNNYREQKYMQMKRRGKEREPKNIIGHYFQKRKLRNN